MPVIAAFMAAPPSVYFTSSPDTMRVIAALSSSGNKAAMSDMLICGMLAPMPERSNSGKSDASIPERSSPDKSIPERSSCEKSIPLRLNALVSTENAA